MSEEGAVLAAIAPSRVTRVDWAWVRRIAAHVCLAGLFFVVSGRLALTAWDQGSLGIDARIYYRGSQAWLAGGNPWDTLEYFLDSPAHYSALPTTVVVLAPFTVVSELAFTVAFLLISAVCAVYIVWTLRLPWYFVLFPPMFQGVQSGNPNVILLALLLSGRPVLEAFAPLLKVYAVIPLAGRGRWRSIAWFALFGALTFLALPLWWTYLSNFGAYNARLLREASGGFSAAGFGTLMVGAAFAGLVALWLRDRNAAAWLAVPALWPATQFHYSIFGMPLMRGRLWLAALLALPVPAVPALVPALLVIEAHLRKRPDPSAEPGDPSPP